MVSVHCKDISVRKVECDITEESIASMMGGWVAYKRAEYVVLNHGDQYAVVRLSKSSDGDLFRDLLPTDSTGIDRSLSVSNRFRQSSTAGIAASTAVRTGQTIRDRLRLLVFLHGKDLRRHRKQRAHQSAKHEKDNDRK